MKKLIILSMILIGGISAMAQTTPGIYHVQKNQAYRIGQGVNSGELTRNETKQLVHQQRHIQHQKRVAKADGVVTCRERAKIRHSQAHANANIYRKKHNRVGRY